MSDPVQPKNQPLHRHQTLELWSWWLLYHHQIQIHQNINSNNASKKLTNGQLQMSSRSPKLKLDAYLPRKRHNNPILKLDGTEILVINQYNFLGYIFDKKLIFIPHLLYLKEKCNKLQLFCKIADTEWSAD